MSERVCKGCGGPLPPQKKYAGRRRQWCSERCRKAQYAASCEECGGPTSGSEGRREHPLCTACAGRRGGEGMKAKVKQRRDQMAAMYLAGATYGEMSAFLGWKEVGGELIRMRAAGYDLPHRYKVRQRKAAA